MIFDVQVMSFIDVFYWRPRYSAQMDRFLMFLAADIKLIISPGFLFSDMLYLPLCGIDFVLQLLNMITLDITADIPEPFREMYFHFLYDQVVNVALADKPFRSCRLHATHKPDWQPQW